MICSWNSLSWIVLEKCFYLQEGLPPLEHRLSLCLRSGGQQCEQHQKYFYFPKPGHFPHTRTFLFEFILLHQGLCVNLAVTWTSRPLEETQPGLQCTLVELCKIRPPHDNWPIIGQALSPGWLTGLHLQMVNGLPSMLTFSFKVSSDGD